MINMIACGTFFDVADYEVSVSTSFASPVHIITCCFFFIIVSSIFIQSDSRRLLERWLCANSV